MILRTKDVINIKKIEGNTGITYNNDIFFSYKIKLPEVYSLSESDYDEISNDLIRYSKELLPGVIEHWQAISIKKKFDERKLMGDTFLQKATKHYYQGREYTEFEVNLYLVIPFNTKLRSKFSIGALKEKWHDLESEIEDIYEKRKSIENAIAILNSSHYIKATPINEAGIKENVLNIITGFNTNFQTDIQFRPFQVGEQYFKCYAVNSLRNLPEKISNCRKDSRISTEKATFFKSFMQSLYVEMPHNHMANMIIIHEKHEDLKHDIEKRKQEFNTWSAWSTTNSDGATILESYLKDIERDETIRLCRAHFNLFTWCEDKKELDRIEGDVSSVFSEIDIKAYKPIVDDQVAYFLCSIPGNAGFFPRDDTFMTDLKQALCLVPYCENYAEDSFGLLLNDRLNNKPIYKDLWEKPYADQTITARNFMVVADTGRGKSILTTHKYRTYLEMGYSLVLCDVGHSNETLAKLYKDKINYVEFKEGQGIGINPFAIQFESELTSEKISGLNDFVSIHWKKEEELNDVTRVSLNFLIKDYYRNTVEKHSFLNFYRYIKKENWNLLKRLEINPEFFNLEEFLHICSEYDKGIYDFLYNGSGPEITVGDKQGILFEFSNILSNPVILPIMSLMARDAVDTKIWRGDMEKKKVMVWEEAAKIIKIPGQLKAMDYMAQTVRKYNASQGLVVQTIDNIPDNEFGKAILTNTHMFFIFEHTKGLGSLAERLSLTDHALDQIKSLRSNISSKTPYTEFDVMLGQSINGFRLELPREAFWAYTGDKDKKAMLYREYEKKQSMENAILKMIEYEKSRN